MTSTENAPVAAKGDDLRDRLITCGRLIRIVRAKSELLKPLEDPELFLSQLRANSERGDIFSFVQTFSDPQPRCKYYYELEDVAVLELTTYDKWWKETVNDKTRNMVRKAGKKGLSIEVVNYTDDFIQGIKQVYDECPVRQGKKSRHYGKSFEVIKREHGTFPESSEFIAARLENRVIGFAKVVFQKDFASVMNLIALMSERDKAPTNALLAKVIERCAARGIGLLHYGVWSRRGFGDFKLHHGFKCRQIPRYYVPLNDRGALALRWGLHRPLSSRVPESYWDWFANMRMKWYAWYYPIK
jgi:hypothetical protein